MNRVMKQLVSVIAVLTLASVCLLIKSSSWLSRSPDSFVRRSENRPGNSNPGIWRTDTSFRGWAEVNKSAEQELEKCDIERELWPYFKRSMNATEMEVAMQTLRTLVSAFDAANISYHMYAGTLLGSWRHHGVIPWDDDIDVRVNWKDHERVDQALGHNDDYALLQKPYYNVIWKFYPRHNSTKCPGKSWRHPYIDIFYYAETPTTIYDNGAIVTRKSFNKSMVFPLTTRPYMDMWLSAPADSFGVLRGLGFNVTVTCTSILYDHKAERFVSKPRVTVELRRLWPCYPFVFRSTESGGGTLEQLKIGDVVLNSVVIE